MKSWIKVERKGKGEYAYLVTPHYDPEIKNTRSSKKYLGTVIGRDETGNILLKPKREYRKK